MHSDELQCNSALLQRCHFSDELGLVELVCNEIDLVHFLKVVVTDGLGFKVVRPSALTSEPLTLLVYGQDNLLQDLVLRIEQSGLKLFKHFYFKMGQGVVGHA